LRLFVWRNIVPLGRLVAAPLLRDTVLISGVISGGQPVPKVLEDLLWCAALATWLMLFCGFIVTALRPLAKTIRQRLEVELKSKEKRS
jgi:hypothetical protein